MNLNSKDDIIKCIQLHIDIEEDKIYDICELLAKVFRSNDDTSSDNYNAIGIAAHNFSKSFGYTTDTLWKMNR